MQIEVGGAIIDLIVMKIEGGSAIDLIVMKIEGGGAIDLTVMQIESGGAIDLSTCLVFNFRLFYKQLKSSESRLLGVQHSAM